MNQIKEAAILIVKALRDNNFEAYFVGGCVRDMVMGIEPKDYDITTSALPDDVERIFERTIAVGKQFGVMIVLKGSYQFEVATFRSDGNYLDGRRPEKVHFSTAKEDVKRRDFTINGLLYDPLSEELIDYVNAKEDIENKVIKAIGNPEERFKEDKLRILRAIRFAARLDFKIDEQTLNAIAKFAPQINLISQERIRDELVKMMTGKSPFSSLKLLDKTGVLEKVLPEVVEMKGVEQNPEFHPEGDVFVHTMLMMEMLEYPSVVLSFATLLHDIGKPATCDKETLKCLFHSEVGAKIAKSILKRLRFSNDDIDKISACVLNHMRFAHVKDMRLGKLKNLMIRETFEDELILHKVDCLASHGNIDNYYFLLEKQEEFRKENLKPPVILNGKDLIALGMKPSPAFKTILEEVRNLQLENVLVNKEAAIEWVKKHNA